VRRIGIDVGGTNTDAVLLEGERVVHAVKTPTTADVTSGIVRALLSLLAGLPAPTPTAVDAVMIGTTHFTNAVVQRRDLGRVAAIRVGLPASASLEPFDDWPPDLAAAVRGEVFMLEGGHEYDGRPLVPLDEAGVRRAARRIRETGLRAVAVASVFSPLNPACEERVGAILGEECPDAAVTLSHHLGRIGLLERENAALLNAALLDLARRTTGAFARALAESGLAAPLYLTQNDGTVMRAAMAETLPVYGFTDAGATPLVAVGGGAFLVPGRIEGISRVVRVPHHEVANAVGAAIAQVSGEADQIFQGLSRDAAIAAARRAAEARAVQAGADPRSLQAVEVEDLPLAYLPGSALRTRVRVVGDLGAAAT
jgi:N-methylhydantoinase A/oxoprolinase/acetone carboxylase beta subunit